MVELVWLTIIQIYINSKKIRVFKPMNTLISINNLLNAYKSIASP